MQLTINLPDRKTMLARNRQRWAEVLADPQWKDSSNRIETNEFGQIIMTPPAGGPHSSRAFRIGMKLESLLGGRSLTECPISTSAGVRAADAAWYSDERYATVRGQLAFEMAPEICVEVLSPSNTDEEMQVKRQLYFDAGAEECWTCDLQGRMSYYKKEEPTTPKTSSKQCPEFPDFIDD